MPPPTIATVENVMQILCGLLEIVRSMHVELRKLQEHVEVLLQAHAVEEPEVEVPDPEAMPVPDPEVMEVPDPEHSDSHQTREGPPRQRSRSPRR